MVEARKLKDFWGSYYSWKIQNWSHVACDAWQRLRNEDQAEYTNEIF
jgi:hypothetical protein